MDILALLNPYRWLLLAGLAGSLVLGYFAWESHQRGIGDARTTIKYEAILTKQKADAIVALAAETAKVTAAEAAMQQFHFDQELKNASNQKIVVGLRNRLARMLDSAGRLRDPNANAGCGSGSAQAPNPAPASSSAGNGAEAGGLLSKQLSEFLVSQAASADEVNLAYIACRADAIELRAELALK